MSRTAKPQQLCCIEIDHIDLLMPVEKALKVIELLQGAVTCHATFAEGYRYHVQHAPRLQMTVLRADQVVMPAPDPAAPAAPKAPLRIGR